ncbi:hypothetical protein GE09DRAFT_1092423, partial [Coniochaeta sp. 2T2.1]
MPQLDSTYALIISCLWPACLHSKPLTFPEREIMSWHALIASPQSVRYFMDASFNVVIDILGSPHHPSALSIGPTGFSLAPEVNDYGAQSNDQEGLPTITDCAFCLFEGGISTCTQ